MRQSTYAQVETLEPQRILLGIIRRSNGQINSRCPRRTRHVSGENVKGSAAL
jgi:hypothetical protein